MTPDQLGVFSNMLGSGNSAVNPATGGVSAGAGMTDAGATGAESALSRLMGYDPTAINNVDATVKGGLAYAGGMDIPGAVRAAMLPAVQTARDVTNPGIDAAAAGTNNINSNRTDLAKGLVDRGLAEQSSGLASDMFNNAFTTGANLTSNQNAANNSNILSSILGALSGGTSLSSTGTGVTGGALDNLDNAYNLSSTGASGPQQANQLDLANQLQKYQGDTSLPYSALSGLMSIIGTGNWGQNSTGTSTTTSTPSAMATIGSLMGAGGSLLGSKGGLLGGGSGLLGLGLFSDKRLKTDIAEVGTLFDGTPVYRYRYLDGGPMQIGLMAHDVEKRTPEAIGEAYGYKTVDYAEATKHLV
jgi:hypothetical protein